MLATLPPEISLIMREFKLLISNIKQTKESNMTTLQNSRNTQCFTNLVLKNNNNDIFNIISYNKIKRELMQANLIKLYFKNKMTIYDKPRLRIKAKPKIK